MQILYFDCRLITFELYPFDFKEFIEQHLAVSNIAVSLKFGHFLLCRGEIRLKLLEFMLRILELLMQDMHGNSFFQVIE